MTSPDQAELPPRLTERELSEHWRVTTRTLQRWRAEGFGPRWLRIGGRILYPRDEVLAYERRQREPG
ncbi:helix-turn-helix domain-containing protein [Pelagovum pacificum]|uniref:Helix-turn-helix domain-containing protein n=1 Tax=Pelagovum pacificum TaxID=2588711 RepID=A0A5C5G8P0_9RHOB|nr:helix-turn-helix domain-containing protein [Pelagovum pacificum]TNY31096.1 helix-turn-helix domain-containing protein [Pelagovum pacificum]